MTTMYGRSQIQKMKDKENAKHFPLKVSNSFSKSFCYQQLPVRCRCTFSVSFIEERKRYHYGCNSTDQFSALS